MRLLTTTAALAILAAVLCGTAAAGEGPGRPPAFVAVGLVTEADGIEIKRYTGHVTTSSSVNLVARVSGELLRLGFNEGGLVEKGQLLYELDDTTYEADVRNLEARIAQAEAKLVYAEISHGRASELFGKSAGTKDSMDSAESEYKAARAALLSAQAELITAKDNLRNTRIIAPISGKIGVTNYTEGNYLTPNSGVIANIVQMDPLRISFSMSNRDYLAMFGTEQNLKDKALLRLRLADDSEYDMEGKVEFINNQANQKTDAIQVFASFENPDGKLIPGSTITVLLSRANGGRVPAVVPSAVMHDSKTAYVYVVDDQNKIDRRDVTLGYGTAHLQSVKSGLRPGEMVVVDGMHKTMPGAVIEPDFQDMSVRTLAKKTS